MCAKTNDEQVNWFLLCVRLSWKTFCCNVQDFRRVTSCHRSQLVRFVRSTAPIDRMWERCVKQRTINVYQLPSMTLIFGTESVTLDTGCWALLLLLLRSNACRLLSQKANKCTYQLNDKWLWTINFNQIESHPLDEHRRRCNNLHFSMASQMADIIWFELFRATRNTISKWIKEEKRNINIKRS